jgi:hypothetical protein
MTPLELVTLQKRGGVVRGDLKSRLREQGVMYDSDITELNTLFTQVPGPSDVVRYMQRDVVNPNVVNTFRLDDGFTDNFHGKLKEYADQQGVTEEQMIFEWRAHWSIPSPTQLYEMVRRLRHNPKYGGPEKVLSDVRTALKQQDILPYWQDKLLELAYHPINLTDARKAFERGWIDDDKFIGTMYQIGYSDDDAKLLLRFASEERKRTIRLDPHMADYAKGFLTFDQLATEFIRQGFSIDIMGDVKDEADRQRALESQKLHSQAIARQYKACRITRDEAMADAESRSIPPEVIEYQLDLAGENTTCGTRRERVATLCEALDAGYITESDYIDRMRLMKYDDAAIQTYLSLCRDSIRKKRAKAQLQKDREIKREADALARAKQRQEQQAARSAQRLSRLMEQQERRKETRNRQLMTAANRLGNHLTDVQGPPSQLVETLFHGLQELRQLSQDEAANVLALTSSSAKGMSTADYVAWVYAVALDALQDPYSLMPSGSPEGGTSG